MPLVNISLQQQEQGAASGIATYPQIGQIKKSGQIADEFSRDTLNPTNAPVLYTSAGTGTETTAITTARTLRLATGGTTANNASVHTSELSFERTSTIDERNAIELKVSFDNSTSTASVKGFIGFLQTGQGSITDIPTTNRHLGIEWDTSVDNNFRLTSANNSTQVTTATGEAISSTPLVLRVSWTGNDSAIINLESITGTIISTQTVTALTMGTKAFFLYFFVETLTNAAKRVDVDEWAVKTT